VPQFSSVKEERTAFSGADFKVCGTVLFEEGPGASILSRRLSVLSPKKSSPRPSDGHVLCLTAQLIRAVAPSPIFLSSLICCCRILEFERMVAVRECPLTDFFIVVKDL